MKMFFRLKKFLLYAVLLLIILIIPTVNPQAVLSTSSVVCPTPPPSGGNYSGILIAPNDLLTAPSPGAYFSSSSTASNYCVSGSSAQIPYLYFTNFNQAKSTFYDKYSNQNKAPSLNAGCDTKNPTLIDRTCIVQAYHNLRPANPSSALFDVEGNFDITSNESLTFANLTSNPALVIFVKGNLNFDPFTSPVSLSYPGGIVFIVKGDIHIDTSFTGINAFMVTFSNFCDAYDFTNNVCPNTTQTTPNALNIDGSVIFLNSSTNLSGAVAKPQFIRSNTTDPTKPSEIITYDPKYMVLFKNIFSQELTIWTEIQ